MNIMTWLKLKFAIGVGVVAVLAGGGATLAPRVISDNISASEILSKAQDKYKSLSSYSDNGVATTKIGSVTMTENFRFRMQRPDLYRLEWTQFVKDSGNSPTNEGAVWSAGDAHFVLNAKTKRPVKDRRTALMESFGNSNGSTKNVPGAFFGDKFASLWPTASNLKREKDESINGEDCYVLSGDVTEGMASGVMRVWFGKKDQLIRQTRRVMGVSDDQIRKGLEQGNKPATEKDIAAARAKANIPKVGEIISLETHENISVNQKFLPTDFDREQAVK